MDGIHCEARRDVYDRTAELPGNGFDVPLS